MSKENDTVCAMRSRLPPAAATVGSKISLRWLSCMFVSPRYGVTTPLGRPVDPDV
ncbi:hypothetical protein GCM10023320_59950 [Pseudonocardia adelaidensis]|uniref:Uncharacterized protein n=1 Tax=Pseudonocardia adelaidensis TaxID=648754 RepID=A0ABP9NTX4_9PSEU